MRRKYYLHKRKCIYYAELVNPENGQKFTTKSTGEQNKANAYLLYLTGLTMAYLPVKLRFAALQSKLSQAKK